MWRRATSRQPERIIGDAEAILIRWSYSVTQQGALHIVPSGPGLDPEELGGFLRILTDVFSGEPPKSVVFDLRRVRFLGPNWTLVLAMFIDFAQKIDAPCHVAGVHGQPAAAAALYNRSDVLSQLLRDDCDASLTDKRQSA